MRPALLGFLILLTCASEGSAHGSIAYGYTPANAIRFTTAQNERLADQAQINAYGQCRSDGLNNCSVLTNFENICVAVAITPAGPYNLGTGRDVDEARRSAISACESSRGVACSVTLFVCDGTPIPEPKVESEQETPTFNFNFDFGPTFQRASEIYLSSSAAATVVSSVLALWIFISLFSATPSAALKRRAATSAWIAFPAGLACCIRYGWLGYWETPPTVTTIALFVTACLFLWTNVFAALLIGGALRRKMFDPKQVPDPLSLPLTTLAFTMVTAGVLTLFIAFGSFPRSLDCGAPPYPVLSVCAYFSNEGFVICAAWLILLIVFGVALPADSNFVLANDRLKTLLRQSRLAKVFHRETTVMAGAGTYPSPAVISQGTDQLWQDISVAVPSGPMMLKIRKSQATNLWGTVVFMIDARMELSAEERHLVERYRLGDMMIYSSSGRDRHKEAIKAHLEGTKGHPVFTMSVKDQLMGVLKTFFGFAMAGAHAAMAAYHLKITVYKLMRGVHVRCKNMNEVLVAKSAIVEAAENLRAYLDVAQSFDGTEEILEF
jgi:hypothetical protein